jgi:acetyl esterase/lipase
MNVEILPYLAMGFAVANVEYRLLAEAPAPAAVADACCALRWVIRNGTDYYLDPTRIVLAGGSAGGHLALMAGMAPSGVFDQGCEPDSGDPPSLVRVILNWGGPGDLTALVDGPQARDFARQWLEAEGRSPAELRERAQWLSPRSYVRRDGPPVLTIHGDADSLISYGQAVSLHAELEQAGVRNRLYTIAGGGHGGFDPEAMTGAFAAIREFLIECGLTPESPRSLEAGRMSLD